MTPSTHAGTSLPEVATSVLATLRGERDIAVGNVIGSNVANLSLEEGTGIGALRVRDDGRIMAAGWIDPNGAGSKDVFLARLLANGARDNGFDGNGVVVMELSGGDTTAAMKLRRAEMLTRIASLPGMEAVGSHNCLPFNSNCFLGPLSRIDGRPVDPRKVKLPGARMKLVGGDSGRCEHEELVESVILAPSERVVVDVLFDREGEAVLEHRTSELDPWVTLPDTGLPAADIGDAVRYLASDIDDAGTYYWRVRIEQE